MAPGYKAVESLALPPFPLCRYLNKEAHLPLNLQSTTMKYNTNKLSNPPSPSDILSTTLQTPSSLPLTMTRIHAAVTLALLCSSHALQPDVIKASGQRTSEAILRDLNQGVKLVNELHTLAAAGKFHDAKGETKGFPDLHRAIEVEIEKVYNSEIGSGGVYSGYYAEERGVMNGVLVPNNRYHVWVGHPPSSPELSCTNPKVRSTCHTPPGTAKGYLETWEMLEDSDHYEKSGLFQNTSYDPRMHEWYHPQQEALHITKPYVFKPDSYSSSIGITLSRGVHKDGKPIGVVAVDVDLSSLDMIIGYVSKAFS